MKHPIKVGFSFGLTSSVITTLGLMVGLYSSTYSRLAVIGGILVIAIADAFSDAMGIHVSEESENKHSVKEIWQSTLATFFSKLVFTLSFIIPVLLFSLNTAVIIGIIWGMLLLGIFSFYLAKEQKRPFMVVLEHLIIAGVVVILTYLIGLGISAVFG